MAASYPALDLVSGIFRDLQQDNEKRTLRTNNNKKKKTNKRKGEIVSDALF